jgi:hypothetical protein
MGKPRTRAPQVKSDAKPTGTDPKAMAVAAESASGAFASQAYEDGDDLSGHAASTLHTGLHDSHDAEQHFDGEMHGAEKWPENWKPPAELDAPPARPGMVQRWIRLSLLGQADPNNVKTQERQGWRPRTLESVPEGDRGNYPTMKDPRSTGAMIVNKDLVLCEMPKRLFDQMKAFYANKRRDQVEALVDRPLAGDAVKGADRHGFGAPRVVERSSTVSTRVPIVAADQ